MFKIYSYNKILKEILGTTQYRKLIKFTLNEVNNKFKIKSKFKTNKVVKINNSYVLILALTRM